MTLVDTETGEVVRPVWLTGPWLTAEQAGWNTQVHTVANSYRLMNSVEMSDLLASIREVGLSDPLVVDADGYLIDGRNRLEACRRLGVPPMFVIAPPDLDVDGYVRAKNLARRHLTKPEQKANRQAAAVEGHRDGKSTRQIADELGVSNATVSRDLDEVLHDVTPDDEPVTVTGKDGKSYAARKPKTQWTLDQAVEFVARYDSLTGHETRAQLAEDYGVAQKNMSGTVLRLREQFDIAAPVSRPKFTASPRRNAAKVLARMCEQVINLGVLLEDAPLEAVAPEFEDRWADELREALKSIRDFALAVAPTSVKRKVA